MRAEVGLVRPVVIFEYEDGVVGGDVGLVENKSLLFRAGPLMLTFF